jgi:hypothetical protein
MLNQVILNSQIDTIYRENFFSLKMICQHLKIWEDYSDEEKVNIETATKRDSLINGYFKYDKIYDKFMVYGELTKLGVPTLYNYIKNNKEITNKDVFIDIGSGLGKLILHMSVISEFKTLVGVEYQDIRYKYSKYLQEKVGIIDKGVFIFNKDIKDFDLSIATVVFCDNVTWDKDFCNSIWERLPNGCHYINYKKVENFTHHEIIELQTTWEVPEKGDVKKPGLSRFHYYIK